MKKILLALFVIFGIGLFLQNNTYAISDWSISVDSSNTIPLYLCGADSGRNCLDYNYVVVEYSFSDPTNSYTRFLINNTGSYSLTLDTKSISLYNTFSIPENFNSNGNIQLYNITGYSGVITITLTESLPGDCPEPPEPDCPDPEENSQYMNVVLDSFWKYQKAFAGTVVAIIVIFIIFRFIKGVMR